MTRADLISDFEAVIDQVGTAEFSGTIDVFINQALLHIFKLLVDPWTGSHSASAGYEKDIHTSEYLSLCKIRVLGSGSSANMIMVSDIEALMGGRKLFRVADFKTADTDTATKIKTPLITSPQAIVHENLRFYKPSDCRRFMERWGEGYKVYPGADTVYFEGVAIGYPLTVSVGQTDIDFPDALRPAIVYQMAMLAGVSIRDPQYVQNAIQIIQSL